MSLKAKIEAVIYAAEEPVTLAQLVGLLGQEAQAELDRADTQQTLALDEGEAQADAETAPVPEAEAETQTVPQPEDEAVLVPEPEAESAVFEAAGEATEMEPPAEAEASVGMEPAGRSEAALVEIAPELAQAGEAEGAAAAKAEKARMARLRTYFRAVLDALIRDYATPERGLEIREVGGGFRLATKPEYHDAVRGFVKSLKPPLKLTLQALETLAVVAYKQPVTAPEISEIRGVDSAGVIGSLIARKLVTTAGRKQVIGRPILYKTTKEFLLKFGLKDVAELPSIEEFEKMAGQMAEQEEIVMNVPELSGNRTPELIEELGLETETYMPHINQDAPADNLAEEDKAGVDGRISSLPPRYDDAEDNPSAREAEIQEENE